MSNWIPRKDFEAKQGGDSYVWIAHEGRIKMAYYWHHAKSYLFNENNKSCYMSESISLVANIKKPKLPKLT